MFSFPKPNFRIQIVEIRIFLWCLKVYEKKPTYSAHKHPKKIAKFLTSKLLSRFEFKRKKEEKAESFFEVSVLVCRRC